MRKVARLTMLALAGIATLALAATASAGYTSPKLGVSYGPKKMTRLVAAADVADDATARVAIVLPAGTTVAWAKPGAQVGKVKAQVSALALGGALLPLAGKVLVAPPGSIPAASQTPCIGAASPTVTLLLVLEAAGQTINLPAYVIPTSGAAAALGSTQLVFCLAPPDIPVASGGATFGAKFLSADLTVWGLFSPVAAGAWVTIWTPWTAGKGTANAAATVVSPAAVAAGAVTASAAKTDHGATVSGSVTQGGAPVAGKVLVFAGAERPLKLAKVVTVGADGAFSVDVKTKGTLFRVEALVAGSDNKQLCSAKFSALPLPCVNGTVGGFIAASDIVEAS